MTDREQAYSNWLSVAIEMDHTAAFRAGWHAALHAVYQQDQEAIDAGLATENTSTVKEAQE